MINLKPRIGITTSYNDGAQSVSHYYIDSIEQAGGLPVIVPMLQAADNMRAFTQMLDGLLITGGPGIIKGLIGELPDDLPPVEDVRDRADTLAFESMQDRPVLGICYGMQFINAQAGGTIYADVGAQVEGTLKHSPSRNGKEHLVQIDVGSRLYDVLRQDQMTVNTYHLQAVAEVGAGLRAVAHSPDGVIEAVESADGRLIGVQFHPERMYEQTKALFEDFIARCAVMRTAN